MHSDRILLKQDKCLVLQPELVRTIGKSPAIVLQQIHYWLSSKEDLGRVVDGKRYIHNTLEDWVDEIKTISLSTLKRAVAVLNDYGLISIQKFNSKWGNRTNWYTINYNKLQELIGGEQHQLDQLSLPNQLKMSQPSAQNEPIIIETKKTNKDLLNNPSSSNDSKNLINKNSEKQPIAEKMLSIWVNETNPDVKPVLNQERARLLVAALKLKFNNSIQEWKTYCQKIASSDYLMGKIKSGFKATIDWVLKFNIIQRIFENQFGVKVISNNQGQVEEDLEKTLTDCSPQEKDFRRRIIEKLGAQTYKSWFKKACIVISNSLIEIVTTSSFHKDWIKNNFTHDLERLTSTQVVIR